MIIGISAYLRSEARGHHYTYHKSLYRALNSGLENKVAYIGAKNSKITEESAWFSRSLPKSMTRNAPWASPFRLVREFKKFPETKRLAFIYEGNFSWLLLTTVLINSGAVTGAHVNLFNSGAYTKVSKSKARTAWIRIVARVIIKISDDRVIITAETQRLAELVSEIIGMKVEAFPYFSSSPDLQTNAKQSKLGQHKKVLINIRGNSQIELVMNLINDSCASCEFTLHGIVGTDYAKIFSNKNVSISQHLVDQEKYTEYFSQFDAMIFAYEKSNFEMQSSGRLMDAIKTGVPVIVPRDTSMADTVKFFGAGTEINLETPDELAEILKEFHNLKLDSYSTSLSDIEFSMNYLNLIKSKFDGGKANPIKFTLSVSLWMLYSIAHLPLNLSRLPRPFLKFIRKTIAPKSVKFLKLTYTI